jgi:hypothetical protein
MVDPEFEKSESLASLETQLKLAGKKVGRDAAITALSAVVEFINSIPRLESQSLALPLVLLASALNDLDQGQRVPMLTPTKGFTNRHPDPGAHKMVRAYAIFAVDELIRFGMSVETACNFVVNCLTRAKMPLGRNFSWKTIQGWRENASRRSANDQQADTLAALREKRRYPDGMSLARVKMGIKQNLLQIIPRVQAGL